MMKRIKYNILYFRKIAENKNGKCLSTDYKTLHSILEWECKAGHVWKTTANSIKGGRWCQICAKKAKRTIKDCVKLAELKNGQCVSIIYINNSTPLKWKCSKNHIWMARFKDVNKGNWCPTCAPNSKITTKHCHNLAKKKGGKFLNEKYINYNTKYLWECKYGHKWKTTVNCIKSKNSWCPECAGVKKSTIEYCHLIAKNRNGKCLSVKYINQRHLMMWECSKGHIWNAYFEKIKTSNHWCPTCGGTKKLTIDICHSEAKRRNGKFLSVEYINSSVKYLWECSKKHQWYANINSIRSADRWCSKCASSKKQLFIYNILTEIYSNIKYNFRGFDWLTSTNGRRLELDIYIPDLKLAIEYDGIQHFEATKFNNSTSDKEADENLKKQQSRDNIKNIKVAAHSDIKYFIRFNYKEDLTEEYIMDKINKVLS